MCDTLTITYVKALTSGHQYRFKISPAGCNIAASVVENNLKATDDTKKNFPAFSFQVSKIGVGIYLVDLTFQDSVINADNLDVTIDYLSGTMNVPRKLIPSGSLLSLSQAAAVGKTLITAATGISFGAALALGATASLWSIVSFQQFVGYFTYINLEFPYQVSMFFSLFSSTTWDFLPNPLLSMAKSFESELLKSGDSIVTDYEPPQKFVDDDMTTSFLENGGGVLTTNLFFLCVLGLLILARKIPRLKNKSLLKKGIETLQWNFIARSFLESGVPLALAIFLQLYRPSFKFVFLVLCELATIVALIYFVVLFVCTTRIIFTHRSEAMKQESFKKVYGTLCEGMSLEKAGSKFYYLIIFTRGVLLMALITFVSDFPVLQVVPLIIYNIGVVLYLFKEAAFEDFYLNIINRIKEILILIGEMFILALNFKEGSESFYNSIGWLIIVCLGSALMIELIYMVLLQLLQLKQLKYKMRRMITVIVLWIQHRRAAKRHKDRRVRRIQEEQHSQTETRPIVIEGDMDIVRLD